MAKNKTEPKPGIKIFIQVEDSMVVNVFANVPGIQYRTFDMDELSTLDLIMEEREDVEKALRKNYPHMCSPS